jgi:hypothetical protein
MPIEFERGLAKCRQCEEELSGEFSLHVFDFAFVIPVGVASGELLSRCADHHDQRRSYEEGSPQHNIFNVTVEEKEIGELGPVSAFSGEVKFVIKDNETYRQFREEIKAYQLENRRTWGY